MTDEQINAAIHDALGNPIGCPRCSDPGCSYNQGLNYCTDLNAMHEAEKMLTEAQCAFFEAHLRNRPFNHPASFYMWHGTARERAKAFLRALEKSKKVQK